MLWPAAALDVYTPGTLEVLNGTDVRLKCTFSSDAPLGKQTVVSWLFRPQEKGPDEFVSALPSLCPPVTRAWVLGLTTPMEGGCRPSQAMLPPAQHVQTAASWGKGGMRGGGLWVHSCPCRREPHSCPCRREPPKGPRLGGGIMAMTTLVL